jgi:hypothetical protein
VAFSIWNKSFAGASGDRTKGKLTFDNLRPRTELRSPVRLEEIEAFFVPVNDKTISA